MARACSRHDRRTSWPRSPRTSAGTALPMAVRCDVTDLGGPAGRGGRGHRGIRPSRRRRSPTPASAPSADSSRRASSTGRRWWTRTSTAARCRSGPRSRTSGSRTRATCCSPARSPDEGRCRARSTPPRNGRSRPWAKASGRRWPTSPIRVTLIEPGMVDTPFFDNRPTGALEPDDIARSVMYALSQPAARGRERDPRAPGEPGDLVNSAGRASIVPARPGPATPAPRPRPLRLRYFSAALGTRWRASSSSRSSFERSRRSSK